MAERVDGRSLCNVFAVDNLHLGDLCRFRNHHKDSANPAYAINVRVQCDIRDYDRRRLIGYRDKR